MIPTPLPAPLPWQAPTASPPPLIFLFLPPALQVSVIDPFRSPRRRAQPLRARKVRQNAAKICSSSRTCRERAECAEIGVWPQVPGLLPSLLHRGYLANHVADTGFPPPRSFASARLIRPPPFAAFCGNLRFLAAICHICRLPRFAPLRILAPNVWRRRSPAG